MKISTINKQNFNFKNLYTPRINDKKNNIIFEKMLNEADNSKSFEKDKYSTETTKHLAVSSPIDSGLLLEISHSKKPLPFEKSDKNLQLDKYQQTAIDEFRNGNNVMVTAPTGTGKTLIAEYIINDILKSGKKVIYTTPLKALCNDKYKQFSALWGDYDKKGNLIGTSKIGLATGDIKINQKAPVVIMTTEVYRNMLTQQGEKSVEKALKDVDAVIFDEFHYMGDFQRGSVWEEALMFSPEKTKHLMLSATISNAHPIANWLNSINKNHNSVVINVPEEERHVPLKHLAYSNIDSKIGLHDLLEETINIKNLKNKKLSSKEKAIVDKIADLLKEKDGINAIEKHFGDLFYNGNSTCSIKALKDRLTAYGLPAQKAEQYSLILSDKKERLLNKDLLKAKPISEISIKDLVRDIEKRKMTPALYFVYSKKNCKKLMKKASEKVGQLLSSAERKEVERLIEEKTKKGVFLGTDFEETVKPCLLNGFAMHHSGLLPQCKSFIEELGKNKLIKVCFATDTLGAGINFPFKTVIFSGFEKYTETGFDEISVNSFKQGAGRAGRRGIDDIGYVISIIKNREDVIIPYEKIVQNSEEIQSAFNLSYNLVLSPVFLNKPLNVLEKSFDYFQKKSDEDNLKKSNSMKELLKDRGFIEQKHNIYKLTPKGKIASKIKGINEILLTEILTDKTITENISPSELATLISAFTPEKTNSNNIEAISNEKFKERIDKAVKIAIDVKEAEEEKNIESNICINTDALPYIKTWADIATSEDNKILWTELVTSMIKSNIIKDEGDFFKKINYTTNVLKQLQKAVTNSHLQETTAKAIELLQKSPVNDILLYELKNKEK